MRGGSVKPQPSDPAVATPEEVAGYFDRLWPIMRSITGDGARQTHDILGELVPMRRIEVPTGTKCFDWIIPREWIFREAYVITPDGHRILDARENTLHLVNYSSPFRGELSRDELEDHLHSLPELPQAVPYVTSYYADRWGFCIAQEMRDSLPAGTYEVVVDTELKDGSLTISEAVLPGAEDAEVLISTYTCHPGLANNELSGPLVAAFLYRRMAALEDRRLSYRFLWIPETIGSLAYLSMYGDQLRERLVAGYVLSCIGDPAPFTYKRSRRGDTLADRAAVHVLEGVGPGAPRVLPFDPLGSDERQYCSPGFDLPVGVVARSIFGSYPEYHTSLDDREFVSSASIVESVDACVAILRLLDRNVAYERPMPFGEPQLGRHGLIEGVGAAPRPAERYSDMLWVLNLADGQHDLLEMAERSGIDFWRLADVTGELERAGLLHRSPGRRA